MAVTLQKNVATVAPRFREEIGAASQVDLAVVQSIASTAVQPGDLPPSIKAWVDSLPTTMPGTLGAYWMNGGVLSQVIAGPSLPAPTNRTLGTLNTVPSGTYRAATGSSTLLNVATLLPQVNGFTSPNQMYLTSDVGSVAEFSSNYGSFVDDNHPKPSVSSWTSTTAVLSTALTSTQLDNLNAMIAANAALSNPVGLMALTSDGLLGNVTAVAANSVTVGRWMAPGVTTANQVPTGTTVQLNPQEHIWAQNSTVYLPASTITKRATGIEIDALNAKGASGANANVVGITCNMHDAGAGFGGNSAYIASGTPSVAPWATAFVSSFNTIGYQSTGDSDTGFIVQHAATDPAYGFVSRQNGGNPFAYNPANTGFAWSVGSNGGMSIGNSAINNGMAVIVAASGSSPGIQAVGVNANTDLTLRAKGTGSVRLIASTLTHNPQTVAQILALTGMTVGATTYATNGRAFNGAGTQEGAGAGTGVGVQYNGTAWKVVGTNVTLAA